MNIEDALEALERQQEREYELEQARLARQDELIEDAVNYVISSDEPLRELEVIAEHMRDSGLLNEFFKAFWIAMSAKAAEAV